MIFRRVAYPNPVFSMFYDPGLFANTPYTRSLLLVENWLQEYFET